MSTVGQGFGAFQPQNIVARLPENPMDKCTIVSIAPFEIQDNKLTTFPVLPAIPAAKDNDFEILVVPATSWFKEQTDGPILQMYVDSKRTAEAYIRDYVNGIPGYIPDVSAPGLFRCYGEFNKFTIKKYVDPETTKTFDQLLADAKQRQRTWFLKLIELSDALWARANGNPLVISRDARIAAEKLNMKDKPWMKDMAIAAMSNCPACGHLVNPIYPVCSNCKSIINKERAKELGIAFAQ